MKNVPKFREMCEKSEQKYPHEEKKHEWKRAFRQTTV